MKKIFLCIACLLASPLFAQQHDPVPVSTKTDSTGRYLYVDYSEREFSNVPGNPVVIITKQVAVDYQCIPNPGNPPAGNIRVYCDSSTGQLTALNSSGGSALAGGGISSVSSLPALPCTEGSTVYLNTGNRGNYTCTNGVWLIQLGQGPVINAAAFGASSVLADNATAFAAAATASNAASLTAGAISNQTAGSNACSACTSTVVTVNGTAGDMALIFITGTVAGRTFTVVDNGSSPSAYYLLEPFQVNGSSGLWMVTSPGGIKSNFTSVTITDSGAAENIQVSIVTYRNVGSYRINVSSATTGGVNTVPTVSQVTQDTNNVWLSGFAWFTASNNAAVANQGTILINQAGTASQGGFAVVTQAVPTQANTTNSLTLGTASNWVAFGIELRSRTNLAPTFYIPQGTYIYSSGLNFLQPVTLKCEPGTVLDYTGVAHAVDFGPTNLAALGVLTMYPFYTDGCTFTDGQTMTAGIYGQPYTIVHGIRNTRFYNFGNSTAQMMEFTNNNWDVEIGPQVKIHVDDGRPRNIFKNSSAGADFVSYVRIHDVEAFCIQGNFSGSAPCTAAQTGTGFLLTGLVNTVSGTNNFAYFNPVVRFISGGANGAQRLLGAMIEPVSGIGAPSPVQFSGVPSQGLEIDHVSFIMHGSSVSPIGPTGGSDTLVGARINFNSVANFADTQAFVAMNNIAGQTNNQSSNNLTSTALFTSLHPAVIPHTTGSNINNFSFNVDDQHVAGLYATTTNCAVNSASPAACAGAAAGVFAVPTTTTTYTINTTAVTANSRIFLEDITDNTGIPSTPTCTALAAFGLAQVTARVAGTSFTISLPSTAGTTCFNYWIVN